MTGAPDTAITALPGCQGSLDLPSRASSEAPEIASGVCSGSGIWGSHGKGLTLDVPQSALSSHPLEHSSFRFLSHARDGFRVITGGKNPGARH